MLPRNLSKTAKSCCLAAVLAALPTTALADRGDRYRDADGRDHRDYGRADQGRRDDDRDPRPTVGISIGSRTGGIVGCDPAPPPPPRVVHERVYVEPVYRT